MTQYFRMDSSNGITPPDLSKNCTYEEHIVGTRGKKTQLTSISDSLPKIKAKFDGVPYKVHCAPLLADNHQIVSHQDLLEYFNKKRLAGLSDPILLARAREYCLAAREAFIQWTIAPSACSVERSKALAWTQGQISGYFARV